MSADLDVAEELADELLAEVVHGLSEVDWRMVATLAGSTAYDRQGIKRMAVRWRDNFAALPPLTRLAVLGAMVEGIGP